MKNIDSIKEILTDNNYNFEKIIIEYAIFDSKISHDNKWVDSKHIKRCGIRLEPQVK